MISKDFSGFLHVDQLIFLISPGFLSVGYDFYGVALDSKILNS